ncbi:hypothetical protein F4805DRAFT_181337 [Annulohypoxylon moriforme]|nr:hypothetical protein F4805DRAFT_181337 [Annulohypoxylon moriforme]
MDPATFGQMILSLSATDVVDAQMAGLSDRVSQYFRQDSKLLYRGVAGMGTHGGALVFAQIDEQRRPVRRIVVKYSLDVTADEDLINEAHWLEQLRGAEHIGQLVPLADANLRVSGTGRRPTLALEFIENGTMELFLTRFGGAGNTWLPNRLLWRILRCLLRQAIAMAFPPRRGPNDPIRRERIPTLGDPVAPTPITQNSPHGRNLMIGDMTPDQEHELSPRIHLIDFGRGRLEPTWLDALELNLSNIGVMMMYITLCSVRPTQIVVGRDSPWAYGEGVFRREFVTNADRRFLYSPTLDPPLRDLVARFLAIDLTHIPSLYEAFRECQRGCERPVDVVVANASLPPQHAVRETDENITSLLREYIFNAPSVDGELREDQPIVGFNYLGERLIPNLPPRPARMFNLPPRDEPPPVPKRSIFAEFDRYAREAGVLGAPEAAEPQPQPQPRKQSLFSAFGEWFMGPRELDVMDVD